MKQIALRNGGVALVDDEDFEKYGKYYWYRGANGYVIFGEAKDGIKSFTKLHRLVMDAKAGEIIDHINGIKTDDRKCNLRKANSAENIHNQAKRRNTKNKYKGVLFKKKHNAYEARCRMLGKNHELGLYTSEVAAAYAYNKKAIELSGFAKLNELPHSNDILEKMIVDCKLRFKHSPMQSIYNNIYFVKAFNQHFKDRWTICIGAKITKGKSIRRGSFKTEPEAFEYLIANYGKLFPKDYNFYKSEARKAA